MILGLLNKINCLAIQEHLTFSAKTRNLGRETEGLVLPQALNGLIWILKTVGHLLLISPSSYQTIMRIHIQ